MQCCAQSSSFLSTGVAFLMRTQRLEVLSPAEVERIHAASMEILEAVGIKVSYQTARDWYREMVGPIAYGLMRRLSV
jgi:trimethylamine:corrinoid methyltransferase-like protein